MKKTNRKLIAATAAAFTLTLAAGIQAQNTSAVRSTDTDLKTSAPTEHINSTDAQTPISKANKASSLIGMDVRNAQNEKLGEIKDLVVDLHTGKIAYAVLSVGGFLGIGDKYIAVPPGAFSEAPDQQRVILNADKARIQNAPGFAKSSWPDVNSSTWKTDSAYWLSDTTAQGTAATVRSGTGTEQTGVGTVHSPTATSSSLRTDHDHVGATTTDSRTQFRGRIVSISPDDKTMTVEGPSGSRQFKLTDNPTITLKENRNPHLTDLKVGYPVVVGFHEDNGTYVAHSIIRSDAPEVK